MNALDVAGQDQGQIWSADGCSCPALECASETKSLNTIHHHHHHHRRYYHIHFNKVIDRVDFKRQ